MRGSDKAVAMLDLWASAKRAARDRALEDRQEACKGEAKRAPAKVAGSPASPPGRAAAG
ncbi:MAG TPA: hypothetical protein VFI16_03055 [Anaeromyxobacteraceae bacterium]|nr:hypothetical protein [Anaeromyxobacteraceae bacterium]